MLRTLQDRRSTVAVALPGTARQLQSQPEHAKRMSKLLDRMAKILVELQLDAAPAEDSAEYQQGLAALRDQQLRHLQQQVELEAAALGLATQERQQLGAASELTRSLDKRSQARRARIRQLVDTISAWQQRDLPSSPVTELLPQQWTEQDIKQLFSGMFPWQQTAGGAGPLPSQLVDRFRDACAEVSLLGIRHCCRQLVGHVAMQVYLSQGPLLPAFSVACSHMYVALLLLRRRPAPLRSWSTCVWSGSALCNTSST